MWPLSRILAYLYEDRRSCREARHGHDEALGERHLAGKLLDNR